MELVLAPQLYAQLIEGDEEKAERREASLYATPRLPDEDEEALVATTAAEVVLVVAGLGVVEALVARVVETIGATEVEVGASTIGVEVELEAVWMLLTGVF